MKKLERFGLSNGCTIGMHSGITEILMEIVENEPTLEVVPKALYDQIKFERDTAISQLESYGIQLGEKVTVKPVQYCHNNSEYNEVDGFVCSECGLHLEDWNRYVYDEDSDDTYMQEYEFKYCPECGTKVVYELCDL